MNSPESQLLGAYRAVFQPPFPTADAPIPKAAGEGRFRRIGTWPDAVLSESRMTLSEPAHVSAVSEAPGMELFFCLGAGMEWDSAIAPSPLTLQPGQMRLTRGSRGMEHACYAKGQTYHFVDLRLTESGVERLLHSHMSASEHRLLRGAVDAQRGFPIPPDMRITLNQLARCPYSGAAGALYVESQLLALLSEFVGELLCPSRPQALSAADLHSVREAQRILDENLMAPPTIAQLARRVYLSESRLARDFRAVTGQSIHQYLIDRRMTAAHALLEAERISVSEAANRVGYINISHFSAAFRKRFGFNPGEYRRHSGMASVSIETEPESTVLEQS